jgi:hypothetical protein
MFVLSRVTASNNNIPYTSAIILMIAEVNLFSGIFEKAVPSYIHRK